MAISRIWLLDDGLGRFGPLADMRCPCDLRTGGVTSLARVERVLGGRVCGVITSPDVRDLTAREHGDLSVRSSGPAAGKPCAIEGLERLGTDEWCVSARWPGALGIEQARALQPGQTLVDGDDGAFVAMRGPIERPLSHVTGACGASETDQLVTTSERVLLSRPWHLLDQLEAALANDLAQVTLPPRDVLACGARTIGEHPVLAAADVDIAPGVVFDTRRGAIALGGGAAVGPNAVIEGPCWIGAHSRVMALAHIRACTVVGDHCKVGGEVSFSIIDDYTNKAHAGFLGHAVVGRWVNLGADTNASNLKNTYGPVRAQLDPRSDSEETSRTFLGPIIGDFVRTAIGTRLTTGCVVGTGAMIAVSGFAPSHVERLTFHTDRGVAPYDVERLLETIQAMMARRDYELCDELTARLRKLSSRGDDRSLRMVGA